MSVVARKKKGVEVRSEVEPLLTAFDKKLARAVDSSWIQDEIQDSVRAAVKELQREADEHPAGKRAKIAD